jgi:hypothetical protein
VLPPHFVGSWAQYAVQAAWVVKDGQSFSLGVHHWTSATAITEQASTIAAAVSQSRFRIGGLLARAFDGGKVATLVSGLLARKAPFAAAA